MLKQAQVDISPVSSRVYSLAFIGLLHFLENRRVCAQFKRDQVTVEQGSNEQAVLHGENFVNFKAQIVDVFESTACYYRQMTVLVKAPHVLRLGLLSALFQS